MSYTDRNEETYAITRTDGLEFIKTFRIGTLKQFRTGSVLFRQGEPASRAFIVKKGAIKVFSLSEGGKIHTYNIFGAGHLVGHDACLMGGQHISTAECMCSTEASIIDLAEFKHLVETNSEFSKLVMQEMAQATQDLTLKI